MLATTLAAFLLLAGSSIADDACYMAVFSSDSCFLQKPSAHCFATFVKVHDDEKTKQRTFEALTISWFPATDIVRLVAPAEPGENRDLKRTLDRAACKKIRLSEWGPYQICPELFDRAVKQKARLECGTLGWQACDSENRPAGKAINCVHAVSDVDCDRGQCRTGIHCGEKASALIVRHLGRWIVNPCERHDWVNELIGVAGYPYPIERRPFPCR